MNPLSTGGSPDRRASRVALRTLRQRPKVVGETAGGDTVYEVRGVRLILKPDTNHFTRLVECSKCGAEVPGASMLVAADLDQAPAPVVCRQCVHQVGLFPRAAVGETGRLRPAPRNRAGPSAGGPPAAAVPAVEPVAAERVAAVEGRLDAVTEEVATLASGLAGLRAELASVGEWSRDVTRSQRDLDARLLQLAARVDGSTAEGARLRDDVAAVVAAVEGLRAATAVRPRPEAPPAPALVEEFERQLEEAESRLARRYTGDAPA